MTLSGGNYNEMSKNHTVDEGLEAMITGSPDPDHPLGRMFSDLRESATGWPTTDKTADHVAAAVQEARLNVPTQASPATMPARRRVSRRRTVLSFLTTSLIGKILLGSMAFAATGGTLAATGSLPDPVQSAVASTVEVVGIHIPDPSDTDEAIVIQEAVEVDQADEVIEVVEVQDADDAVELEDTDEAALEDADEADEVEDAAAGLECAEKATELGESDEVTEVDSADSAAALGESDEAKDLNCSDEATELEDADEATEVDGSDEATELEDADETIEVDGSDEATELEDADEAPEAEEATG